VIGELGGMLDMAWKCYEERERGCEGGFNRVRGEQYSERNAN